MAASLLFLFLDASVWTALGACLFLATAVFLFVFYIDADASDLAPHRPSLINSSSAAIPFTTISAILNSNIVPVNTLKVTTSS